MEDQKVLKLAFFNEGTNNLCTHTRYKVNPGTQCKVKGKSEYYTCNQNNEKQTKN